jgi:hypothetical protein
MLLFLVPAISLLIAEGICRVRRETSRRSVVGALLMGVLLLQPVLFSTQQLFRPTSELLPLGIDQSGVPRAVGILAKKYSHFFVTSKGIYSPVTRYTSSMHPSRRSCTTRPDMI